MKQEHKHCLKRVAAAALVMLMVSGTVPFQPIAEVFDTAIVASAEEINYTDWTDSTKLPTTAGSYRLTADVTLSQSRWEVPGGTTNLDLNGHTIALAENKVDCVIGIGVTRTNVTLNLYDSSDNGSGRITGGKGLGYLGNYNGGGVYIGNNNNNNATFNMYGGSITKNTCKQSSGTARSGGGVYIKKGTFNMYGGSITDNEVNEHGGGVYVNNNQSCFFNMYGGTIKNNIASKYGGGVCNYNAFNMTGGTIENNIAKINGGTYGCGGGVYSHTNFSMTGGTITNNTAGGYGGGVFTGNYNQGKTEISGDPKIVNNTISGSQVSSNLHLYHDISNSRLAYITITEALSSEASIGIKSNEYTGVITSGSSVTASDYVQNFFSDDQTLSVITQGTELALGTAKNVTNVTLNKNSTILSVGAEETLTATVSPDDAVDKTVTWASDNTNVATVDGNGKITAVGAGTANITATATNGTTDTTDDKTATCEVTVCTHYDTVAATCISAGNIEYYYDGNSKYYTKDGNTYTEITQSETVIPATGHDWNAPIYEWIADNAQVTATRTCKNDATHVETETVNTTSAVTNPATCEDKGETTYTAAFTNEAFAIQTKTVTNIDEIGHSWNAPTYTWSADNSTCTAKRVCAKDASHVETETVNTTAVTKDPTCVDKGQTIYTATFTNTAFETQTKTIETTDATGDHTYGERSPEWSWVKNGNTFDVSVKFKCAVCDEYETTDIKPTLTVTESNGIRKFTATVTHDGVQYTSERDEAVKYSITINGTPKRYKYGELVTVTAPAPEDGKYFDGWYEGETKVSGSEVYTLYATRDISIEAKYKETKVEAQPVFVMNVSDREKLNNGKQKVSFTYDWDLPEGYTLVKAAIVRSYVETEPNISTANTNVHYTALKNARGTYKLNLTLGTANATKTVYVRGYIVYKDKAGTEYIKYTNVLTSAPASN